MARRRILRIMQKQTLSDDDIEASEDDFERNLMSDPWFQRDLTYMWYHSFLNSPFRVDRIVAIATPDPA